MTKKTYQNPAMLIVKALQTQMLCGSEVDSVTTNLTGDDAINYGGAGNGPARVRESHSMAWENWE